MSILSTLRWPDAVEELLGNWLAEKGLELPPPQYVLGTAVGIAVIYAFFGPRRKNATIPGPYEWPILGNFVQAYPFIRRGRFHDFIANLLDTYGDIVHFNNFGRTLVITRNAEVAKRVLGETGEDPEFYKRDTYKGGQHIFIHKYMLFGMGTTDVWRMHRKFLQPAFGPMHLRYALDVTNEVMDNLDKVWGERCDAALMGDKDRVRMDVAVPMTALTLDVIGKVAFSYDFGSVASLNDAAPKQDFQLINVLLDTIGRRFQYPHLLWKWAGVDKSSPRVREADDYIDKIVTDVIKEKRALMRAQREANGGVWSPKESKAKDLLDRLLEDTEAEKETRRFTDEEIIDEVFGFFLAGHEYVPPSAALFVDTTHLKHLGSIHRRTTSNTLTFILLELCRNPDVRDKLEQEIDALLGKDGKPTWENLPQFKYTERVVKEAQRLHSIVGGTGRIASKDLDILGHRVAKGTQVNVSFRRIHVDPRYWPDPYKFNPDRWIDAPAPGTYVPFGDGPHVCIGQKMALIEARIAIIRICQKFRMTMLPNQDLSLKVAVTTSLKYGLMVDIERRP
ncbi:Thromboxane-A synthase [Borealophlyctis nickersoniae]|nr:Thromboxane-A synthase [Borealophlyctis nickersoniae]